jgi:hypothetical protein
MYTTNLLRYIPSTYYLRVHQTGFVLPSLSDAVTFCEKVLVPRFNPPALLGKTMLLAMLSPWEIRI